MDVKNKGSVLLICYYFPPMGMGGTQRSAKFSKYLAAYQWKPVVVTVKDVHYYAHDESLLEDVRNVRIFRTESLDPLRFLARFKKRDQKSSAPQTINRSFRSLLNFLNNIIGNWLLVPDSKILWIPFAIVKSIQLIRQNKAKVIYTTSPPHSAHIAGLILKLMTRVKWIADFRDDWTGGESQPCPTYIHHLMNRFLEKLVLKYADRVVGMCDHLTNTLYQKSKFPAKEKFITIMNGYDPGDFTPVLNTPQNSTFTITHCGSISKVSYPDSFLRAYKKVLDDHPEVRGNINVQFIGTDIFGQLNLLVEKYGLGADIKPIKYLPHQQALAQIMASHVLLITVLKKTDEEIITGKIFEYLGSGKKILMISGDGYVPRLIQQLDRGVVIEPGDIQKISDVIYSDLIDFQKNELSQFNPLDVVQFDRRKLTGELASLLDRMIKR